jgi:hypothetical protein
VAWLDLENTLVLRMDDPGGAQNIYNRDWSHSKLMESNWAQIGVDLRRRNGRLSIAYVTGWVDDANADRGSLRVREKIPARRPGTVYDSPTVEYVDLAGHAPGTIHDYGSEYRGIQMLRQFGLVDVELHGYTHMHPDSLCWAQAPDRYESVSWFRELGKPAEEYIAALPPEQHPLVKGAAALRSYFETWPTTLICPGDQWTGRALERALDLDLKMVSSYYLAIRHHERFCWTQHVCAPYLDEPDACWLDSDLPIVGYFHDRDLALGGVEWMTQALDRWQEVGVRRIMDFRELAAAIERRLQVIGIGENLTLRVSGDDPPPLVKPLLISIRSNPLPSRVSVEIDGHTFMLPVHHCGDGEGRMQLPCAGAAAESDIENIQA